MDALVSLSEKFHPRNRHWPSGMPESIARTEHKEPESVPETEIAWAAGFFDGEGNIYRYQSGIRIGVSQAQREGEDIPAVLSRFQKAVGGVGNIKENTRKDAPSHHLPLYVWRTKADTHNVMDLLWPYLSPVMKDRFERARFEAEEFRSSPDFAKGRNPYKDVCMRGHNLNETRAFYPGNGKSYCSACRPIRYQERKQADAES